MKTKAEAQAHSTRSENVNKSADIIDRIHGLIEYTELTDLIISYYKNQSAYKESFRF